MSQFIHQVQKMNIPSFQGVCYQCHFEQLAFSDLLAERLLNRELEDSIKRSVAKRKSEYVAGRYLATIALQSLGSKDTFVPTGDDRSPVWPKLYAGSITHADGKAMCAVALRSKLNRVGLDLETVIEQAVASDIISSILVDSELDLVGPPSSINVDVFTIIFSAKESLFKCLYPEVKKYFDFKAARMIEVDFSTKTFQLELTETLTPFLRQGKKFEGLFDKNNNMVFTLIAEQG